MSTWPPAIAAIDHVGPRPPRSGSGDTARPAHRRGAGHSDPLAGAVPNYVDGHPVRERVDCGIPCSDLSETWRPRAFSFGRPACGRVRKRSGGRPPRQPPPMCFTLLRGRAWSWISWLARHAARAHWCATHKEAHHYRKLDHLEPSAYRRYLADKLVARLAHTRHRYRFDVQLLTAELGAFLQLWSQCEDDTSRTAR